MINHWPPLDVLIASGGILGGLVLLTVAFMVAPDQYGLAIAVLLTCCGYLVGHKWYQIRGRDRHLALDGFSLPAWLIRVATGLILVLMVSAVGVSYHSLGRPVWVILVFSITPAGILSQISTFAVT